MKRCGLALLAIWAMGQMTSAVEEAGEAKLHSLKRTYESEIQRIRESYDAKLAKVLGLYGEALSKSVKALKREGDLDNVLSALAEQKRFEISRSVPDRPEGKLPDVVLELQTGYRNAERKANIDKGQAFVDLTRKYVVVLDRLMKTLTAKDKLDLALDVKAEKDRVDFLLAEVEAKLAAIIGALKVAEGNGAPEPAEDKEGTGEKEELPIALRRGLFVYYDFDDVKGRRIPDKSGRGNHGRACYADIADDDVKGVVLDVDSRCYVDVDDGNDLDPGLLTVAAWTKPTKGKAPIVDKHDWQDRRRKGYVLRIARDMQANFTIGNGEWYTVSSTSPLGHDWVHLVGTFDGSTLRLYVDGREDRSKGIATAIKPSECPLRIGRNAFEKSDLRKYEGLLDDVMLWNRALSDAEIRQVYELTRGK